MEVIAFERGTHTSYAACGLPYFLGGEVSDADALVVRSPDEHRRRGIDVRIHHEVELIDLEQRVVRVRDLDGNQTLREPFDQLVIATGAEPVRPKIPGIDATGVHVVKTLAGAIGLRRALETDPPRRAVIVGAGYIGIEVAEALLRRGIDVTMIDRAEQPMITLDAPSGALVADALRSRGVELVLNAEISGIIERSGAVSAVATAHSEYPADLAIIGLGVRPEVGLARAAGLRIGDAGAISVDDHMATSEEGVYAAGDCVEVFHRVSRRYTTIALGTHANKQGQVAGVNAAGGSGRFAGVIGSAITKFFETEIARTGLSRREAEALGVEYTSIRHVGSMSAGYMPNQQTTTVELVADANSQRLLGAQVVGGSGAGSAIKWLAAAVWNEMTLPDIVDLDLPYVPPLGPLWEPAQDAARRLNWS